MNNKEFDQSTIFDSLKAKVETLEKIQNDLKQYLCYDCEYDSCVGCKILELLTNLE